MPVYLTCVLTLCSLAFSADCPLYSENDGAKITLHGEVRGGAHDMLFSVPGCKENLVLVYAEDEGTAVRSSRLDKGLQDFKKLTSATYRGTEGNICLQCPQYEVEATLTGTLNIAVVPEGFTKDAMGFVHDKSGKVIGKAGFGHPVPFAKYRLVIESASNVVARKLSYP